MTPLQIIKNAKKVAVFPSTIDGDSVASALALMLILQKLGKKVDVFSSFSDLDYLRFLPHIAQIKLVDLFSIDLKAYDLGIFVDGSPLDRFYDRRFHDQDPVLPKSLTTLVIDHHIAGSFSPNALKDLKAASTTELIYKLFKNEVEIDRDIATYIYLGIMTDTGRFKYSNTTPQVMQIASELLEKGVDSVSLTIAIEQTQNLKTILFRANLIPKIKVNEKLHYAYLSVALSDWQSSGLSLEELETAVVNVRDDEMRSIDGVDFTFRLTEYDPGFIRGSLRSRIPGKFNLEVLAKYLSGGGHPEAAGFSLKGRTIPEAEEIVHEAIKSHYEEMKLK